MPKFKDDSLPSESLPEFVTATVEQPEAKKLTPEEHAQKHGQVQANPVATDPPFTAHHMVADVMHGWAHTKHFKGGPILLTDEQYLGAIEATKRGEVHAPANLREAK